ncbi:MAG: M1 family metallopeptidase [Bacteroidales bacterium]|nr:M1 family metallopeptidase [Bacteroidales bacterium]
MKKTIYAVLLSILMLANGSVLLFSQDHESRYNFMDVSHYSFYIELNDSSDAIRGLAKITFSIQKQRDSICFDLAGLNNSGKGMIIDRISDENGPVSYKHVSDRIIIYSRNYKLNENKTLSVYYHGVPAEGLIISKNRFGDRTFFGDNWPNKAHQWIPCVDHPADKAFVEFTVTAPSHYQVVSNGSLVDEDTLNGIITSHWRSSVPLPTKVMVIGVAEFAIQNVSSVDGTPISTWVYRQNEEEGFRDYAVAIKPFAYYSSIIAPFPFSKLANVQSTTIYGGMENASCIFYAENSVTGKGKAEELIAHEIAHQWFGDAVSEKDWYHIWLSEGFATYLTRMYIEQTHGTAALVRQMNSDKKRIFAYEKYRLSPIIDTTQSISEEILNPNTYQKASWGLHMLRKELGDSIFLKSLETFYSKYKYGNALTEDFINVVESVSGKDVSAFFRQWYYEAGHPVLNISWSYQNNHLKISVEQMQENNLYQLPLELKIINKNSPSSQINLNIKKQQESFDISYPDKPVEVIPDPGNFLLMEVTVNEITAK